MNLNQFITHYNIRPADAIVMRKKFMSMVDHFVIYVGVHNGIHQFVANHTKGVQFITYSELDNFLEKLQPTRLERFPGNEVQREKAIHRAVHRLGERDYRFFSNNCEHFKNWVHYGTHKSEQVEAAGQGLLFGLGAIAVVGVLGAFLDNKQSNSH